jgi:hypothetical protein
MIDITDKITAANAILLLLESLLLVRAVDECPLVVVVVSYPVGSHDIMYLPTSNLNCSGNGETPDNTNIEISLIYNSTCPPGFKEISVKEIMEKKYDRICLFVYLMVFNATFNNMSVILWQSVLLVEETSVPEVTN